MKDLLILFPHGLGDCILLTPALREFHRITGHPVHIATLERFRSAQLFEHCPYVDKVFYTKDAWNDYANPSVGFQNLKSAWRSFATEQGFGGFVMPMHSAPESKILLNLQQLGVRQAESLRTEIFTSENDKKKAREIVDQLVGGQPFGFVQTNTGVPRKDLPAGFGQQWLRENKSLTQYIEVGQDFSPFEYNINIQFEILRLADAVCIPDSVFYHACHAMDKPIDFVYFARGQSVYDRVKPLHSVTENIVYDLKGV